MKYLRKINEMSSDVDYDFVIAKIKEKYSKNDFKELYDKEKKEWTGDKDDKWFNLNDNGKAKDIILTDMLSWFQNKYYKLSSEDFYKIKTTLDEFYS
jgi:hypothetical protein